MQTFDKSFVLLCNV